MSRPMTTPQELEKKQLELKEKYNFKLNEKERCYSFEYRNKKAFLINLTTKENNNKITPYFIRRGQLNQVIDTMYDEAKVRTSQTEKFIGMSMEIIANMLDESRMGSIDGYINHIWEGINELDDFLGLIDILGDIISMIDITVEKQVGSMDKDKLKSIHDEFMSGIVDTAIEGVRVFAMKPDGEFVQLFGKKKEDNPEPKYDLRKMTPLNIKEI